MRASRPPRQFKVIADIPVSGIEVGQVYQLDEEEDVYVCMSAGNNVHKILPRAVVESESDPPIFKEILPGEDWWREIRPKLG